MPQVACIRSKQFPTAQALASSRALHHSASPLGGSCSATTEFERRYRCVRKNTQNPAKKNSEIENFEEDRRRKSTTFIPTNSHDYRNDGDTGRPAALKGKVRHELEAHLERSPQEFGLNRVQWDGPTLVVHLKRRFGIALKVRQAQNWMHQLGYRMKRASHAYLQARSEDARRFQRALKKTVHP